MNNDKITSKVIEWLQEDEDTNISDLNSETDTESEHSDHDTETEQSGNIVILIILLPQIIY